MQYLHILNYTSVIIIVHATVFCYTKDFNINRRRLQLRHLQQQLQQEHQ